MHAIVPALTGMSGGSRAPAVSPRAIQKASASSALSGEKPNAAGEEAKPASEVRVEHLCRDETSRFDPFWDGPRLVPAFVAQLLGQAMPERRETTMIETPYGRAVSPRKALLLDRKS